jgi:hypothetical protein
MSKPDIKIDDIQECATQALFFLNEIKKIGDENTIYKNASKQFIGNIITIIKDAGDSIQSTSTSEST